MNETAEVTGVVLSAMPIGEYDRRVLLLTRERGKISAFARGARKPGSPLMASSRPCTFARFYLYEGRNAYTVQRAEPIRYFEEFSTDVEGVSYACYFMELAEYYTRENMESTQLLNLLFISFKAILRDSIPNTLVRRIFELRIMTINGEYPQVSCCTACGKTVSAGYYSIRRSSLFCTDCAAQISDPMWLEESVLYTLNYIITAPLEKLFTFQLKEEVYQKVERVVEQHKQRYIDKEFHSLEILNQMDPRYSSDGPVHSLHRLHENADTAGI